MYSYKMVVRVTLKNFFDFTTLIASFASKSKWYTSTYIKSYFLAQETQMDSDNSLFEKNLIPGISSRLPLNTASVFYFGVIGKGKRSDEQEVMQVCMYLNSSS